jgi:Uma2 family endonuclease
MTITLPEVPAGGFTVDKFEQLPDELPHYVELIEGSLVVNAAHASWHARTMRKLANALEETAKDDYAVDTEIGVRIDNSTRPEPDVIVIQAAAYDRDAASYPADEIVLVVEIVSPESTQRDRLKKPDLYRRVGIKHFWRVEREDIAAVVYTYELDPVNMSYVLTGTHRGELSTSVPWSMKINLNEIVP